MKNVFGSINLVVGVLFLLIGFGIFYSIASHPANAGAGFVAAVISAVCLWLAKESYFDGAKQLS